MKNPLLPKRPGRVNFLDLKKSAGILDDYAVRRNVATKEGTIEHVPTEDNHIVNKKYVDDSISGISVGGSWDFTIISPNTVYDLDHEIFIAWTTQATTITKIIVNCDANPATELTGDLKYADDFITLANASIINDFDTTDGKRTDTSITSGAVASGKAIYLSFDAQPDGTLNQVHFHIEWEPT